MSRRTTPILVGAAAALAVAALGGSATDIGPWYYALHKPSWQPPNWAFPVVWTLIYAVTALAGVVAWRAASSRTARQRILVLFAANALLNVGWSELFFKLRRPDWALIEVVPFWFSIVLLIVVLARISSTAGRLLLPYLAWVAFAAILNLAVVRLNPGFGA
jgi:tryptophan-rich sensory protein